MAFEFLSQIPSLTIPNLTIREATRLAQNPLDLRFPALAPVTPVDSVVLSELTEVDFRPVGGRREWNAQGREIVPRLGPRRDLEMVPINPTHHIDERRLQLLRERSQGMQQLFQRGIIHTVDTMATVLANACHRQVERDFFQAWSTNSLTVYDPKTEKTVTVALGIAGARYVTEGTAWNVVANAYTRLLFHIGEAVRLMGSIGVIRMRLLTAAEVIADAPTNPNSIRTTIGNLSERLSEEGFGPITIVIDERTYEENVDGGSVGTSTPYIPTGRVLFQPANGIVGSTYVAPVTRAEEYFAPEQIRAGALQGVVVMYREKNDGKTLMEEAQMNALGLNTEQYTYVVNAGV